MHSPTGSLFRCVALLCLALPLATKPIAADAAAPSQLPLCGNPQPLRGNAYPPVLHVGARPLPAVVSERSGHSFVALSGQRGSGGTITVGCRSSVTTIDTASGRALRRVSIGIIPGGIAVDDVDGRVFVAGMDEATFPQRDTPELTILNTRGEVVKPATPFSACPCAGSSMSLPSVATDSAIHRVYVVMLESVVTFDAVSGTRLAAVPANVFGAEGTPSFSVDTVHHRVFAATDTGVTAIDGRTGALIRTINLGDSERAVAVDGRTNRLFVAENAGCPSGRPSDARGGVTVLDGSTGKQIGHVLGSCALPLVLMDEPARRVLVGLPNGYSRQLKYGVLDARSGALIRTLVMTSGPGATYSAVESGTGRIYYVTNGAVQILDPRDWQQGRRIVLSMGASGAVTIASRLHRLLVTDLSRGTVTILPAAPPATG